MAFDRGPATVISVQPIWEDFGLLTLVALCPVMANNGLPGHVAGTSALPPTADLRVSMSVIVLISSALPPTADVTGGVAEGPLLTRLGHSQRASIDTQSYHP